MLQQGKSSICGKTIEISAPLTKVVYAGYSEKYWEVKVNRRFAGIVVELQLLDHFSYIFSMGTFDNYINNEKDWTRQFFKHPEDALGALTGTNLPKNCYKTA